jgi:diguanylate cyclase
VLRRSSNDIGGIIDVSVGAIGLGGLLWVTLVHPRMETMAVSAAERIAVLVSLLVLIGVLGALARVRMVAGRRLLAVELFMIALAVSLIGNTILAMSTGSMTTGRPGWVEMLFLVAYLCVGAVPLHPSMLELTRPGPDPVDRLTVGRLVFLGVALVATPLAGGTRELAGLHADGPLLVLGSLLVAPLVMVRVGRLAWQREQRPSGPSSIRPPMTRSPACRTASSCSPGSPTP